ncbi:MAG: hypothetical protein ABH879_01550, partial [archaeon]
MAKITLENKVQQERLLNVFALQEAGPVQRREILDEEFRSLPSGSYPEPMRNKIIGQAGMGSWFKDTVTYNRLRDMRVHLNYQR